MFVVILSDLPYKDGNVRFTTVLLETLSVHKDTNLPLDIMKQ